jgi:inner membrane protein
MLTAHLPAGYLVGRALPAQKGLMAAAVIGGILPDFDMIWFHLIDNRAFHHHRYWVHAPGFWLAMAAVTLPILAYLRRDWIPVALAFLASIFVHLLLDTIAGDIMWLWPYSTDMYHVFTVHPTHSHWVWSFMAHWTFALELAVWAAAITLYLRPRKSP